MLGKELAKSPQLRFFEKLYVRLLGAPVSGLRIRLRRVLPELQGSPKQVLDAGCGRGVFSYEMAKIFPNAKIIGVDIDEKQLEVNRKIAISSGLNNITFTNADITTLPFTEEFDTILSVDNLEHIENDELAIERIYQALKPGGQLVLHVPGLMRRWFFFKMTENFYVPGHVRPGYTQEQIIQKLTKSGFCIQKSHYTFGWLETISNNISYVVTKSEEKNKFIIALLFPLLNFCAYLGRKSRPKIGAGVFVLATKGVR